MRLSSLWSLILAGFLLDALGAPAFADGLLQDGTPELPTPLSTYGMQVNLERAIHSVLPPGWQAVIAPDVTLPGKVSWGPNDTWLGVIARISAHTDAGILVDWNSHEVIVRSRAATMQDAAEREEVRQAASTPLPKFRSSMTAQAPAGSAAETPLGSDAPTPVATALPSAGRVLGSPEPPSAAVAVASKDSTPGPPTVTPPLSPTPSIHSDGRATAHPSGDQQANAADALSAQIHSAQPGQVASSVVSVANASSLAKGQTAANALGSAPALQATPKLDSGPARAFSGTSVRVPLEALATRHGLTLLYQARETRLPGPVTLMLGEDLTSDLNLLARALGPRVPLEITEYRAEKQLVVRDATVASFTSLAARPVAPAPKRTFFARLFGKAPPSGEHGAMPAVSGSGPPGSSAGQGVTPSTDTASAVQAPVPPRSVLEVAQGERLSVALERFLKAQGWSLAWNVQGDLAAATAIRIEGASLNEVLQQVLQPFGLAADLYKPSRFAVIRAAQPDTVTTETS